MNSISFPQAAHALSPDGETEGWLLFGEAIEDCNDQAAMLLGCARDALLGAPASLLWQEQQPRAGDSEQAFRERVAAARAGLPQTFRWRLRRARVCAFDALAEVESVQREGHPATLMRIRELPMGSEQHDTLAQNAAGLRQILDNSALAIFVKDSAGRYLFANRRYCEFFGVGEIDIVGRHETQIEPAEILQRFHANDLIVLQARAPRDFEQIADLEDGPRVLLSTKFPLLDARGEAYAVCGIATDITERKRTEDALRRVAIAVSEAEGDAVFQELTRHLTEALGVECAFVAMCKTPSNDHVRTLAVYSDGSLEENVEYALRGTVCGTVVGQQFRFLPSGVRKVYPADPMFRRLSIEGYAAYPVSDGAGNPLGLIAAMSRRPLKEPRLAEALLKIFAARAGAELERKRSEEARRVSEASYRAIFDASEDAIFVHDWESGAIVDVNPMACELYGYARDELLRASVEDLSSGVPPFTASEAMSLMEQARAGKSLRFEWRRKHRDGSLHWDEVHLKAAVIAGQKRLLAFTREITARKQAENALRASEEQYRAIFATSVDGMVMLNSAGEVVDANPAYLGLFGCSRDQLMGIGPRDLLGRESPAICGELWQAASSGLSFQRECRAQRCNGEAMDIEVRGVQMHYQGHPHLLCIVRDITARKRAEYERIQLEAQLRQAQKMEAIGHLTGGIAHDFNNILTSIMGYIVLAGEREAALSDARLGKYLEQARLASTRARDLIQKMLTFSRGQRGERELLSLSPLIEESVKLLRSTLPSTIDLQTDIAAEVPPVQVDPVQLQQVLLNLCINARDAVSGAGSVGVSLRLAESDTSCASCRGHVHGPMVALIVRDTGSGITPEVMERMFEPFFSTKEVGKGSGMGLSTVHGIVHEHGGHVVVESRPGEGAVFRVLFPPVTEASADVEPARLATAPRRAPVTLNGHVLVVEDEETVGQFMGDLLAGWGLRVTVQRSAIEARELIIRDPRAFDLVLLDQTMPKLTGLELASELSTSCPELPVILYTGYSESLSTEDLDRARVRALVRKPVEADVLLHALQTHLPAFTGALKHNAASAS
jgi:PAS domain S-box-containing protein